MSHVKPLPDRPPEARQWVLLRMRAGLTQREAAEQAGIHQSDLCNIEVGVLRAGRATRPRLVALYGEDAADLVDAT